jgi:MFS family permease
MTTKKFLDQNMFWVILITGLGFFVDSYDAFSFNVTRVPSLTELGLAGDALTHAGILILNCLVTGSLVGGFFWGMMGDKIGRKKALIGSIITYSVAMILNSFVHSVDQYMICRFFIGFGIAGEVGLGATLVGEALPKSKRTFGLALFTILGLLGVAAAALCSQYIHWRTLFITGGIAGLVLLFLRHFLLESKMFLSSAHGGSFIKPVKEIFTSWKLTIRYISCVLLLAPNYFLTGFLLTLSPEFAKAAGVQEPVKASTMLGFYFLAAAFGDLLGAMLTYYTKSRKIAMAVFLVGMTSISGWYLSGYGASSASRFYAIGAALGLFNVWALSTTVAVEQFPTHLRATVSTSVLNFARATVVIYNLGMLYLKPSLGIIYGSAVIGGIFMTLGLVSTFLMRETYHADLEKIEL